MKRVLPLCALLLVIGWLALDRFYPASGPRLASSEGAGGEDSVPDAAARRPAGDRARGSSSSVVAAGFALRELGVPGGWREVRPVARGGRPLVLAEPPRRIVSQALVADEILLALGVGERLVAVSRPSLEPRFSLVVEQASRVGQTVGSSAEQILALRPDLVFLAVYTTPETQRQLELARAPAMRLDRFDSLEAIRGNVRVVGFAVGEDAGAEALVREMDRRIERARGAARAALGSSAPRILAYEDGAVAAGGTVFDAVASALGARNVAAEAGLMGWPRISAEQIASWNPDLLVVPADADEREQTIRFLRSQPGLGELDAVRRGDVAAVPRAVFSTVSHHVASLAESLASSLAEWAENRGSAG